VVVVVRECVAFMVRWVMLSLVNWLVVVVVMQKKWHHMTMVVVGYYDRLYVLVVLGQTCHTILLRQVIPIGSVEFDIRLRADRFVFFTPEFFRGCFSMFLADILVALAVAG
jgi:hypothetical protein